MLLQLAWITLAQRVRSEAIAIGRFQVVQAEQLRHLDLMRQYVSGHVPDMELERLHQEGDDAGVVEHLQHLQQQAEAGE